MGFDLIRIQLPHPLGNIRIQIPPSYTGHAQGGVTGDLTGHVYALRVFHAGAHSRTLVTILIIIILLYIIIIINFIIINTGTEIITSRRVVHIRQGVA